MTQIASSSARIPPSAAARIVDAALLVALVAVLAWWANGLIALGAAPGRGLNQAANLFCALGELALGGLVSRHGASRASTFALGAVAGLQFFVAVLGLQRIDPQQIGWLLQGDWAQHYAGWVSFRNDGWHWPLGAMPNLLYPVGSSIVYTDSLPLLALPLKLSAAALPADFQYIGAWIGLSFVLQGGFGALLARSRTQSPTALLAASLLFVAAPVLLARIHHDTLTAHWLLLAALLCYLELPARAQPLRAAMAWWVLAAIAALVHPYFVVMIASLHLAYWTKQVRVERAASPWFGASALAVHGGISLLLWYASGALLVPAQSAGGGQLFGHYNFNLLGFVNVLGSSRWLADIPLAGTGQYEGFGYLGLGVLSLLVLLLAARVFDRDGAPSPLRRHWPLLLAVLLLTLLAIGSVVTFGPWTLFGAELDWPPLAALRSSGRFIWPAYYVLFALATRGVLRRFGTRSAGAILSAALLLQLAESGSFFIGTAQQAALRPIPPAAVLTDPRWQELATGRHHLTLAPTLFCGHQPGSYLPFQLFAAEQHMTFNGGYYARWDIDATNRACRELYAAIGAGQFSADDLYIVGADWRAFFDDPARVRCEQVETYTVCRATGAADPPAPP